MSPDVAPPGGRCPDCHRPRGEAAAHCFGCGRLGASSSCAAHRDRVARRACLVCGTPLCRRCRRGGRYAPLCETHASVTIIQGWAEVARARDEARGALLAESLRSADIEASVFSQKDRWHVVTFGGLSVVRVLVPADRFVEAVRLLQDARMGPRAAG